MNWKGEGEEGREKGKVRIIWDRKRNGMKSYFSPFAQLISKVNKS